MSPVAEAISRSIGAPIFALNDEKSAAEFNAYREQYRSFRVGDAKGAKGEVSQFAPKSTPHIVPPFLTKLYDMVNCDKYQSLIHWSNDGKAVCISNIKQFSEVVLPQYFKHRKFASFLRQLNMYNFYTTRQEPELREFKNPNFIRDNVNLMSCIKRKRAQVKSLDKDGKSTSKRQKLNKQKQQDQQEDQQHHQQNDRNTTRVTKGRRGSNDSSAAAAHAAAHAAAGGMMKAGKRGRGGHSSSSSSSEMMVESGISIPVSAARQMQRELALAVGQANAARAKCSTLQRTVDDCHRDLNQMRREMENIVSCIEQLCYVNGDQTKHLFASLFETHIPQSPNGGRGMSTSGIDSISASNSELLMASRSRGDGSMEMSSNFLFDGFYDVDEVSDETK